MKDGYIEKGYTPKSDDLEKIRQFTRKEFNEDELFIFNLILCDNDIDRDFEKFSVKALNELAVLFVGKTGIFDHMMKASNQMARVFDTWVEKVNGKKTLDGEDYYALKAKAYMVRSDENSSLITDIEAGIKKEVSVSCSMNKNTCSICNKDRKSQGCTHINGRTYNGKKCFSILSDALDAYEWSFVAVPAQKQAGVTKSYKFEKGDISMEEITKCLKGNKSEVVLSKNDADALYSYVEGLEEYAELGKEYKKLLVKELVSLCSKSIPQLDLSVFKNVASVMTTKELLTFKEAFEKQQAVKNMPSPQLSKTTKSQKTNYNEFRI